MVIEISRKFVKQYHKVPANIKSSFQARLRIFMDNPFSPILNNHGLKGKWQGHRSVNITGDWRAVYFHRAEQHVVFRAIGTHSQLYK